MRFDQTGRQERYLGTLADIGYPFEAGATILDFGCGSGEGVKRFRELGYRAFGADIYPAFEVQGLDDHDGPVFRVIEMDPYRVPFDNDMFDFVYSEGVFEHVKDYGAAFSEIRRVLKPGSVSIHLFPARWRVIEGHIYVPFAGAIQNRPWLQLWAKLGVRNEFQKGQPADAVAAANYRYLRDSCTYYPMHEVRELAVEVFGSGVDSIELVVAKNQRGPRRHLYPLMRGFPPLTAAVRHFHMRALLLRKDPN
jgi:SAM-dependent methyltransferase